ncbi:MAG TPA: S8 family serine peptidase, partial [Miltoncostaea sp.]|nr:S8 family serine peptidase [Miltoncostaea sp.]
GTPLLMSLAWTSPLATGTLSVERADGAGGWSEVARSAPAGPTSAAIPVTPADGAAYRVVVAQTAGPPQTFDLFSETVGFGAAAVADGSIPTPGDARGALTVGAVKWTGTSIEPYSSQGVPGGGKPDVVGPTYVTSNPEWPGTAGTSAATAHVAGAAVLLRQRRLQLGLPAGPAELRGVLESGALDLGAPGPDPVYGWGMARLDTSAPALLVRVGPGPRRLVRVRATDAGTVRQVQVTLNGRRLGTWRRPVAGVRLPAGARGRLEAIAEDRAGNVGRRARTIARAR